MIPEKYTEMIHRAIFETISERERGELDRYLSENPEAAALYDDLARMSGLMSETPGVEPPAGLKRRILNLVEAKQCEMERERGRSKSEEKTWKQRGGVIMADTPGRRPFGRRTGWLIGGAVAVVAIVLVIAFVSQPPSRDAAKGTIGGAEKAAKYRAGQISETDVVLENPEFQQLLQNDQVQDLVRSPEFQKLMNDAAFLALLNDPTFVALMSDQKFVDVLGEAKLTDLMSDAKFSQDIASNATAAKALLSQQSFAEAIGSMPKQLAAIATDPAFAAFASEPKAAQMLEAMPKSAAEALADRAVQKMMMNATFQTLAASEPAIAEFMSEPALIQLMSQPTFVAQASAAKDLGQLKSEQTFADLLNNAKYARFASGATSAQVLNLLRSNDCRAFMSADVYRQMPQAQARQIAEFIGNSAVLRFFDSATMRAVMESQPKMAIRLFSEPKAVAAIASAPQLVVELANEPTLVALMNEPRYRAVMASHQAQMADMMLNSQFRQVVGSQTSALLTLMNTPTLKADMLSEQRIPMMMASQAFMKVMAEPKLRQQFYEDMPKMTR